MTTWNYCLKRMPSEEPGKQYLIRLNDGRMACAEVSFPFSNAKYALWIGPGECEWDGPEVSHWAELPEGPKDKNTMHLYTRYEENPNG